MKIIIIQLILSLFCLDSNSSVQAQTSDESLSTIEALDILKTGHLIFVLPTHHTKITNAKALIEKGKLSTKSHKRMEKMIAQAGNEQSSTITHYLEEGNKIYKRGQISFIMDFDLQNFFTNPNTQYFVTNVSDEVLAFEFTQQYIICYPTRSKEQSLEVFAFKGMNNQSIDRPFPKYIRRQNGFDNLRHLFLRTPTKKLEAIRVFRSINKYLNRLALQP